MTCTFPTQLSFAHFQAYPSASSHFFIFCLVFFHIVILMAAILSFLLSSTSVIFFCGLSTLNFHKLQYCRKASLNQCIFCQTTARPQNCWPSSSLMRRPSSSVSGLWLKGMPALISAHKACRAELGNHSELLLVSLGKQRFLSKLGSLSKHGFQKTNLRRSSSALRVPTGSHQ